jgi:hypothetical protein
MGAVDVIMPNDPRVGDAHPTMALSHPRTQNALNQTEWVSLYNPVIASVLEYFIRFPIAMSTRQGVSVLTWSI